MEQFEKDDVYASQIALIGVIGAILTFVIIVALQVLYFRVERGELERKHLSQPSEERAALTTEHRQQLMHYKMKAPKQGLVTIPIARAMELVLKERAGRGTEGE